MAETKEKKRRPAGEPEDQRAALGQYRLPHNLEAERGVLGAMLLDNEIIPDVVEILRGDEFYLTAHRLIFEAMCALHNRGLPVDLTLLIDELNKRDRLESAGGYMTIANLEQFVFSTGSAPEQARSVAEKATLRKLMRAAEHIICECAEESHELEQQIDLAEKSIFEISQQTQVKDFQSVATTMGDVIAEIGALRARDELVTGVSTGFIDLDTYLNGLHPSDLLILAARPSIGKTAFALNLMLNIAYNQRVPVAIFSLEMGVEQLNKRLLCCHAGVSGYAVSRGALKDSDFAKLREKAAELAECPIFVDDTPGLSIMQVRSKARRLKALNPTLGLIVVDYLQLMSGNSIGRDSNRQQEVAEVSRGLKALAKELHIPVMALSQLSRNIEQRSGKDKSARPQLSDLRESGAIEQDADIVMFVHRERIETKKDEDGKPLHAGLPIDTEIIIGKHRNGPIGTAKLHFWADLTRFTNVQA